MNLIILVIGLIVLSFVIYTVVKGLLKLTVVILVIFVFLAVFNQIMESNIIKDANDSIDNIKASEEFNKTTEIIKEKAKETTEKGWEYLKKKIESIAGDIKELTSSLKKMVIQNDKGFKKKVKK